MWRGLLGGGSVEKQHDCGFLVWLWHAVLQLAAVAPGNGSAHMSLPPHRLWQVRCHFKFLETEKASLAAAASEIRCRNSRNSNLFCWKFSQLMQLVKRLNRVNSAPILSLKISNKLFKVLASFRLLWGGTGSHIKHSGYVFRCHLVVINVSHFLCANSVPSAFRLPVAACHPSILPQASGPLTGLFMTCNENAAST